MKEVYVGSTTKTLEVRWKQHIRNYKNKVSVSIYPYFKEHGIDKFEIELIKEYQVVDERHLHVYETLWYNMLNCIPEQTHPFVPLPHDIYHRLYKKEYHDQNRDKLRAYKKEYYDQNKDKARAYGKERIKCECGVEVSRYSKSKHMKTKKHARLMSLEN